MLSNTVLSVCLANRDFSIHKHEGGWDSVALEVIEDATKEGRGADVGAVVLGNGQYLYLLRNNAFLSYQFSLVCLRYCCDLPFVRAHDRNPSTNRHVHPT
jgi:hypothetical protein